MRDTGRIIEEAARTLDLGRPVGLILLGIMGQLPDDEDPWALVAQLVRVLEPGSYVALADGTDTSETMNRAIEAYNAHAPSPSSLRGPDRIASFLDGLELVEPGVVRTVDRRPDPGPDGWGRSTDPAVSGVGRKP